MGGLAFALYKTVPEIQKFVDDAAKAVKDKVTGLLGPMQEEGKKFMAAIFGGGEGIEKAPLINTDALFAHPSGGSGQARRRGVEDDSGSAVVARRSRAGEIQEPVQRTRREDEGLRERVTEGSADAAS